MRKSGGVRAATGWRKAALLAAVASLAAAASPAAAQETLTGVIIRGRAVSGASAAPPTTTALAPGVRVESPPGTWTEIAFSDGSSVVLEQGADFTLQRARRESGRLVVAGASGRGQLRLSAASDTDVLLQTANAEVRVSGASALVVAGPGGSVTHSGGRSVTVRRADGRQDVLQRAGFAAAFAENGAQRRSRGEMVAAVAPFAPVERRARTAERQASAAEEAEAKSEAAGVPIALAEDERRARRQRNEGTAPGSTGRQDAGAFGLASQALTATGTPGSFITAPGVNAGTSNLDGSTEFIADPNTPGPGLRIFGIEGTTTEPARQLGAGRLRRFNPEASVASPERRDFGNISTSQVQPRPASGFRADLAQSSLAQGQTVYDATVAVGYVRLQVSPSNGRDDLYITPRFTFSDGTSPTLRRDSAFILVRVREDGGFQEDSDGRRIPYRDRAGRIPTFFAEEAERTPAPPGYAYQQGRAFLDDAGLRDVGDRRIAYRGSSVFEVGVLETPRRAPADLGDNATQVLGAPNPNGRVFALAGGNGLAVYRGPALPQAEFRTGPLTVQNDLLASFPSGTDPLSSVRVAPAVFIIDKYTESSQPIEEQRGIRPGERFFIIGGTPVSPSPQGLPGSPNGQVTRFAVSDGLNFYGGVRAGETIEDQFLGANRPVAFGQYNAFRPEETFVAGAARGDTHLLAVSGEGNRNPAFRADLQVAGDGRSSASVSAGRIGALPNGSLALSGRTVGSSRAEGANTDSRAIRSNLGSLGTDETGEGAHVLPTASGALAGQAGHFAIGETDPLVAPPGFVQDNAVASVAGQGSSPFGFTRLASNVGPPAGALPTGALNLQGFASATVEAFGGGSDTAYAASTAGLGGISVTSRNGNREFDATLRLTPTAAGNLPFNPFAGAPPDPVGRDQRVLEFGADTAPGGVPTTGVASVGTFAGVIPNRAAMASVDADLHRGIAGGEVLPTSNEHLAWGFFLGDLVDGGPGGRREHAGLGFWVAGRPVDPGTLATLRGTASYSGGMIGTVAQPETIRAAVGQFTQNWDFGARSGSMAAAFDGAGYNVRAAMPGGSNVFTGSGLSGDRRMVVQGGFFNAGPLSGAPAAVGGAFGISGASYGANGVFVGARR